MKTWSFWNFAIFSYAFLSETFHQTWTKFSNLSDSLKQKQQIKLSLIFS